MQKLIFTVLIFFYFSRITLVNGQFFGDGNEPNSITWRQINTEKFRLVYDANFELQAQRIAALLDYSTGIVGNTLNQPHNKVPILIHNHSVISNGMVAWAPKRMEWYTVAPQDNYAQDWFEQLAIHEGRHWAQMNRLRRFPTTMFSVFTGQSLVAALSGQASHWFLEGDAVTTETALTQTGRGRLPSFEMGVRTHMLETRKAFSFRKSYYGSFKEYVPDYYELGYLMVAYNRAKYGPSLWEGALDNIGAEPIIFVNPAPLLEAIKRKTGFNRNDLYLRTYFDLTNLWTEKAKELSYTPYNTISNRISNDYTSYKSACLHEGDVISLKHGVNDIPRIVRISNETGNEEILASPGYISSQVITCSTDAIYWDEVVPDMRWEQRSYSVICQYSFSTKTSRQLTSKTRYFAPSPSPNGSWVAVVETDTKAQNSIVLLDTHYGIAHTSFLIPENAAPQIPSWDASSKYLVMTLVGTNGKSLVRLNTSTGNWETLIEAGRMNISNAKYFKNQILFNGSYSGIDNIYAFNTETKQISQVTSAKYGAFEPCPDAATGNLLYSNYTAQGFDIAKADLNPIKFVPLEKVKDVSLHLADKIAAQEPVKFNNKDIVYKTYESKPYNKVAHLAGIHSWFPAYFNTEKAKTFGQLVLPGYTVASQNLLNTLIVSGGQGFSRNHIYTSFSATYTGLFPVFDASITRGDTIKSLTDSAFFDAKNPAMTFRCGVSVPLNLSAGNQIVLLVPGIHYSYENTYFKNPFSNVNSSGINTIESTVSFVAYRQYHSKAVEPRLGFSFNALYNQPLIATTTFSPLWAFNSNLALPGLGNNSSIILSAYYENQSVNVFPSSNQLPAPRGYTLTWQNSVPPIKDMTTLSADYVFPIAFPDKTIGRVIYIPRIVGALYAQMSKANIVKYTLAQNSKGELFKNLVTEKKNYSSLGIELTFDFNMFFIPVPLNMGVRSAYLPTENNYRFEFITRMGLSKF